MSYNSKKISPDSRSIAAEQSQIMGRTRVFLIYILNSSGPKTEPIFEITGKTDIGLCFLI